MEITIIDNQPLVTFTLFSINDEPFNTDFLLDTWFMWSIALIVDKKNSSLLKIINTFNVKELDEKLWLTMWNWIKAKTYSCRINIKFFWDKEDVEVLIIEWEVDDIPVIWIEFLKNNKKHLSLDFLKMVFKLI